MNVSRDVADRAGDQLRARTAAAARARGRRAGGCRRSVSSSCGLSSAHLERRPGRHQRADTRPTGSVVSSIARSRNAAAAATPLGPEPRRPRIQASRGTLCSTRRTCRAATAALNTMRQVGGSIAAAALSVVLQREDAAALSGTRGGEGSSRHCPPRSERRPPAGGDRRRPHIRSSLAMTVLALLSPECSRARRTRGQEPVVSAAAKAGQARPGLLSAP